MTVTWAKGLTAGTQDILGFELGGSNFLLKKELDPDWHLLFKMQDRERSFLIFLGPIHMK